VWVGPKAIPADLLSQASTWVVTHPDWERILWTDRPDEHPEWAAGGWTAISELPPIINAWAYEHLADYVGARSVWAARSDVVRMEIVARFGGVYSDLDVTVFQPIDDLLEDVELAVADEQGPCHGNYLFAARRNHPAMWTAVRELEAGFPRLTRRPKPWWHPKGWRPWQERAGIPGILSLTGPHYLNGKVQRHPACIVWPWQLFNPLHARCDRHQVEVWPESCYGSHNYAGTWYDQVKTAPPAGFRRQASG